MSVALTRVVLPLTVAPKTARLLKALATLAGMNQGRYLDKLLCETAEKVIEDSREGAPSD